MIKEKLKKREVDELKKLEKILKKDRNDFEEISGPGANVKQVHDRIVKTINNMRKVSKELAKVKKDGAGYAANVEMYKANTVSSIKKKNMLSSICNTFMGQNKDLYLKHELMLD